MVITYFLFFTIYSTDWLKNGKKTKNPSAPLQQPQWPFLTKNIFAQLDIMIIPILNIIVYKDFSLEQGLFWPRDLIMYKYKIFSLIFHDTGIAEW